MYTSPHSLSFNRLLIRPIAIVGEETEAGVPFGVGGGVGRAARPGMLHFMVLWVVRGYNAGYNGG